LDCAADLLGLQLQVRVCAHSHTVQPIYTDCDSPCIDTRDAIANRKLRKLLVATSL
ncbi:hypothetical protein BaRGS_00000490, partial [Batillaria attramentaria]